MDRKQHQYQKKKNRTFKLHEKGSYIIQENDVCLKGETQFLVYDVYLYIVDACYGPRVSTEIDTLPLLHELWTTTTPCWPWASYEMNDALLRIDLWMN